MHSLGPDDLDIVSFLVKFDIFLHSWRTQAPKAQTQDSTNSNKTFGDELGERRSYNKKITNLFKKKKKMTIKKRTIKKKHPHVT